MYGLIMQSRKVLYVKGGVATRAGEEFVVNDGEWGPGTTRYNPDKPLPTDTLTFETFETADEFARSWGGHPWTFKPNGKYRVVKLTVATEPRHIGYTTTDIQRNAAATGGEEGE